MMNISRIFAVSFIAISVVTASHATVVTQSNVKGSNGISVTVPATGQTNEGKVVVSGTNASTSAKGVIQIATDSDVTTGSNTSKAVTPKQLSDQIKALDGAVITNDISGGNVVAEVTQTDGKITVTHGKAVNAVAAASGEGNVVTAVSLNSDGKTINVTKSITALTSQDISGKADKAANNAGIASGDTSATHTKITYNNQGIVTGGTDLVANDVPSNAIVAGTNTSVTRNAADAGTNPGAYKVNVATANGSTLGVVKQGTNVTISNGSVSVATANGSTLGLTKQGTNVTVGSDGAISVANADASTKGVAKLAAGSAATDVTAENAANKASEYTEYTAARDANDSNVTAKRKYPSVYAVDQAIQAAQDDTANALDGKIDKQIASTDPTYNANKGVLIGRDKNALAGPVALTDLTFTSSQSGERNLSVNKAGTVSSGNTGIVTGGTVYTEVRPNATNNSTAKGYLGATTDTNGAKSSATTATNLTQLDSALKTIHPNTGQVMIPSGSETSSTLAAIWVE